MAIFYSDKAKQVTPGALAASACPTGNSPGVTTTEQGQVVAVEAKIALTDAVAINDTMVGFLLPAGHVPVDLYIACDDLDTGAALTLTVAVLDSTLADVVANTSFITASTVGQAGGVARAAVAAGLRLAASAVDRWIGIKVAAAANVAAAGSLSLVGLYRVSDRD